MRRDFYLHLDEMTKFKVQYVDREQRPIDLTDAKIEMAVARELELNRIVVVDMDSGIEVLDYDKSIIQVSFIPSTTDGFKAGRHHYQLRITDKTGESTIALEGLMYIEQNLFTNPDGSDYSGGYRIYFNGIPLEAD